MEPEHIEHRTVPREPTESDVRGTKDIGQVAQEKASEATGRVRAKAESFFSHQKESLANEVEIFAQALHKAANSLESEQQVNVAGYSHHAAEGLERFARLIRERDLDQIAHDVRGFARRRPGTFLGGAMVAGFLLSRFFKSSPEPTTTFQGSVQPSYDRTEEWSYETSSQSQYRPSGGVGGTDVGEGIYGESEETDIERRTTHGYPPRTPGSSIG